MENLANAEPPSSACIDLLSQNRWLGRSLLAYTTERWSARRYRVARFSGRTLKRSASQFPSSVCQDYLIEHDKPNERNRPEEPIHETSAVSARSQSAPQPVSDRDPTNAGQPTPSFVLCGIKDSANCARVRLEASPSLQRANPYSIDSSRIHKRCGHLQCRDNRHFSCFSPSLLYD